MLVPRPGAVSMLISPSTSRARSRGETSGEEVESRRATGLCSVCRSEDFVVPVPFAKDVEAARPRDEKIITACDALQRRALRGNRLENIGGTPRKTVKPGPEEAFKLTRRGASGQPVGNCKTQFSRRQLEKPGGRAATHVFSVKTFKTNCLV